MTTPSTYKWGYPDEKYSAVVAFVAERDPTSSDVYHPTAGGIFPLPTIWVNKGSLNAFILTAVSAGSATWEGITIPAAGDVEGPASATDNAITRFDGTSGKLIQDSVGILSDTGELTGITALGVNIAPTAQITIDAGTAVAGTAPLKLTSGTLLGTPEAGAIEYDGTFLKYTDDLGVRFTLVTGPTVTNDNRVVRTDGVAGSIQQSGVVLSDADVMTFPAGGGVVLTSGGAAATRGTTTLVAGASPAIATTSVAATSAICLTITALGTVTAPQAMYVTITPGVSFIITSADGTDTSVVTWAIVG